MKPGGAVAADAVSGDSEHPMAAPVIASTAVNPNGRPIKRTTPPTATEEPARSAHQQTVVSAFRSETMTISDGVEARPPATVAATVHAAP